MAFIEQENSRFSVCTQFVTPYMLGDIGIAQSTALGSKEDNQDLATVRKFRHPAYDYPIVLLTALDGHGGFMAAHIVDEVLQPFLMRLKDPFDEKELVACIENLDRLLNAGAGEHVKRCGTCVAACMLTMIDGGKTYKTCTFHTGDTGALILDCEHLETRYVSKDHKPDTDVDETRRIYEAGGSVRADRVFTLNISRALGDAACKADRFAPGAVISTPTVHTHTWDVTSSSDTCIVFHTDGVFDNISSKALRIEEMLKHCEKLNFRHMAALTQQSLSVKSIEYLHAACQRAEELGYDAPKVKTVASTEETKATKTDGPETATATTEATPQEVKRTFPTLTKITMPPDMSRAVGKALHAYVRATDIVTALMDASLAGNSKRRRDNQTVMAIFIPRAPLDRKAVSPTSLSEIIRFNTICKPTPLPQTTRFDSAEVRREYVGRLFADAWIRNFKPSDVLLSLGIAAHGLPFDAVARSHVRVSSEDQTGLVNSALVALSDFLGDSSGASSPSLALVSLMDVVSKYARSVPFLTAIGKEAVTEIARRMVSVFDEKVCSAAAQEFVAAKRSETKIMNTFQAGDKTTSASSSSLKRSQSEAFGHDREESVAKRARGEGGAKLPP